MAKAEMDSRPEGDVPVRSSLKVEVLGVSLIPVLDVQRAEDLAAALEAARGRRVARSGNGSAQVRTPLAFGLRLARDCAYIREGEARFGGLRP